jgi:ATP-dependent protease Clp ATPase subunit
MPSLIHRVFGVARRFQRPLSCTVCGQPRDERRRLVAGPSVAICEQCIALSSASSRAPTPNVAICSLCERGEAPIAGSWPKLAICVECVGLAQRILAREEADRLH